MRKRVEVKVANLNSSYRVNESLISDIASRVVKSIGFSGNVLLEFVFLTDAQIRRFNRKFKREDRPTDVLSFGLYQHEGRCRAYTGAILISIDRARSNARRFYSVLPKELVLYIIHGILHLLGYDDEKSCDKTKMSFEQDRILERLWTQEDLSKVLTRR